MSNLIGLHDKESAAIAVPDSWILHTVSLSNNPKPIDFMQSLNWITRLNWGYGSTGTLPISDQYPMFARRVVDYVSNSHGCSRWVIGNECNLSREWPNGQPIFPWDYAACYKLCRKLIHALPEHEKDEVLVAASGPWNNELKYATNPTGDWIQYFADVIRLLGSEHDGYSLHAYTHGYFAGLASSTVKMDAPFQDRYYEFRTYRNYLGAVPVNLWHLPAYITEANGNGPWQAVGLIPAMLKEIDDWNSVHPGVARQTKISAVIFYRYPHYDDFYIEGRDDVIAEYREAAQKGYKVPETFLPSITQPSGPTAIVTAPGGANIRIGPGLSYKVVGAVTITTELPIIGRSADSSWWRVDSVFGIGWVSNEVVNVVNAQGVPIILVTVPISETPTAPTEDNWRRSYDFVKRFEGGYQNVYNDKGNWTGCAVGKGELKGTNFGISACSYPDLDIKNISPQQAEAIFFRDYWQASGADRLPYPASLIVLDTAVLHGVGAAKAWLAEVGPNPYIFAARRLRSYIGADNWDYWAKAWVQRVIELLEIAGKSA